MDEKRLSELLKDAVSDAPPATFDHSDVTSESERQRIRHRNGVVAGSAFGVALLAGAAALGVALWTGPGSVESATAASDGTSYGNGNAAPNEVPDTDVRIAPQTEGGDQENFPPETPKQGGSSDGNAGPAGPGGTPSGCEQADRELAAALAGELPAAANLRSEDALPVSLSCPADSVGAAYRVVDDGVTGTVSVVVLGPDSSAPDWPMTAETVSAQAQGPKGGTVLVVSEPTESDEPAPYGDELSAVAQELSEAY
jgi:hypothetical protein